MTCHLFFSNPWWEKICSVPRISHQNEQKAEYNRILMQNPREILRQNPACEPTLSVHDWSCSLQLLEGYRLLNLEWQKGNVYSWSESATSPMIYSLDPERRASCWKIRLYSFVQEAELKPLSGWHWMWFDASSEHNPTQIQP